jgi:hypothetical protein
VVRRPDPPRSGPRPGAGSLPVDPERLRRQFPALSDEDLEVYIEVTRRVLLDPAARGRVMAELFAQARRARDRRAAGETLDAEDAQALRYLAAVEKMQGPTSGG